MKLLEFAVSAIFLYLCTLKYKLRLRYADAELLNDRT